ncbi:MAG TPA: MBL fold metallo-hydrolase [Armatimonadota bacterium]|nr:MBL fold metallo-hydrolase [Armatimonadota bacterium]
MSALSLTWLGQSGFLLQAGQTVIACDLYLSNYCQEKSRLDHTRLMPIPVAPECLGQIDHYLITHAHIDHFDPYTVGPILHGSTSTQFYCPPACQQVIDEQFADAAARFTLVHSQTGYELAPGIRLLALPAAHEELEHDDEGEYIAMSYLLLFADHHHAVFFGGDTIPFEGQGKLIQSSLPDDYSLTMVLPVNGRDAARAKLGFKGNFTIDEAIDLFRECQGSLFIPCHFGMFALNDIPTPLTPKIFTERQCRAIIPQSAKPIELLKK